METNSVQSYFKVSSEGLEAIANSIRELTGKTELLYFVDKSHTPDGAAANFIDAIQEYIDKEILVKETTSTLTEGGE